MSELIKILEKQLEIESAAAKNKLTASNLDSISKLRRRSSASIPTESMTIILMLCMTRISRRKSHIRKSETRDTGTNSWNRSAA